MIKSINYQANRIASIEISDAEDVQSLGDSWGYGSTARVTGKTESEYMYTPQGWIKTADGSSGGDGGVLVVHINEISSETNESKAQTRLSGGGGSGPKGVLDKTWKEIYDAPFTVLKSEGYVYPLYYAANEQGIYVIEFTGAGSFTIDSENGYATNAENDLEA